MRLVWKLLRQHISIPQFVGFFFANLFGMFIILLGYQFYGDVMPVFTAEDGLMKANYLILNKKIGAGDAISGRTHLFSNDEIDDLASQPFVRKLGRFTSAGYKMDASMGIHGTKILHSELPIESVPDGFVDVQLADWKWHVGDAQVPIILPRSYITMYNFGFAQSHSLPKISEGLVGMIDFDLFLRGQGKEQHFNGRVIGFSNRLNAILVPQSFMEWSNETYAPDEKGQPSRLMVEVDNPADEQITQYMESRGYELEDDKLSVEKTTYFLKLLVFMVMGVGLVISLLSFYILMLSIYLLVQKNSSKLENLLLIGYSSRQVAWPYQLLTILLNAAVLLLTWLLLFWVRSYYMNVILALFPETDNGSMLPAVQMGCVLFAFVSLLNMLAIRMKIIRIGKRSE